MRPAIVSGIVTGEAPVSYWLDYEQSPLFSWSVEQNARDTQMTTRVTEVARRERLFSSRAAALVSRVSRLCRSTLAHATLARACTALSKSEEKERLLAV